MSHDQPLNDSDLLHLADLLEGLPLHPSERERSDILLACGRAEGRTEARRQVRNLRAGLLVFAGVSACLLGLLLNRPYAPETTKDSGSQPIAEVDPSELPGEPLDNEHPTISPERFKTFGVLTPRSEWDRELQQKPRNPSPDTIELVSQQETLTTHSRTVLNELLN